MEEGYVKTQALESVAPASSKSVSLKCASALPTHQEGRLGMKRREAWGGRRGQVNLFADGNTLYCLGKPSKKKIDFF